MHTEWLPPRVVAATADAATELLTSMSIPRLQHDSYPTPVPLNCTSASTQHQVDTLMKTMKLRFLSTLRRSGVFGQQHIPSSVQCRCRSASSTVVGQEGCDVAVVGGGIMGLSSAYFIKQMNPDARVCVLERDPQVSGSQR